MVEKKKIVMLFLMMLSFVSLFTMKAEAVEEKGDIIKQIYLTDSNGNRPTDDKFNEKDTVRVNVVWSVPDNSTVSGDYFSFTLPDILAVNKDLDFDLKDQNGESVAQVHLDSQTKRVVVTFNEYVETHSNVKGTMYFNAKFDTDKIDGENDYNIEFIQEDGTIFNDDITVTDEEEPFDRFDEVLRKFGYFDKNDPTLIHWVIRVNVKGIDIHDAVLTDEIGEGHSLVKDSLKVSKLKYKVIDGKLEYEDMRDVTSESNIEIPNDNKFIIYFGDILEGHGYYINYSTRLVGDGNASNSYTNKASLIGNDEEIIENSETHQVDDGGGDVEGDTGSLEIIKKDSEDTEKRLQGAEFDLIDADGKIVAHVVTDQSGKAVVKDLKYGYYQLVETKSPEGYELEATPIAFKISEEDQFVSIDIENTKSEVVEPLGNLELIKVDSKDKEKLLSGAEFDVLDSNGEVAAHVVTDKNGKATVKDMKYGNYQLIETKAPEGYELDETPRDFIIDEASETVSFEIENTKSEVVEPLGNLELIKVDSKDKDKLLSGAEFDVLNSNGEVVAHVVTNKKGKATVKDLKYGNYQLVETKASEGYELDKKPVKFLINEKTSVANLKITNVKKEINKDNENTENGNEDNKEETVREELPKTNEEKTLVNILLAVGLVVVSIQSVFILKKFKS
ncbi:SpaA isopeptide-forming pilin-related protein [Vagococcus carniphilus]|uniref:SpaA isopeptide-forming pilin-related protein n=1 Tax=Vagococcus carniphilus TaxID=218144 RepID=UPI00288FE53D|nr:SpaA isopeptide-forming pilin-related protein [Vagococcus carniphilus]MDT2864353.1 SpaA isopeptide-forming pilin-related protein [Vagococcus carniphilus]